MRLTLRRFFETHAPMTMTRSALEAEVGTSKALWQRASDELALPGIAIAESAGGQGFGLAELAIALSESGRALAPIPLLGVVALTARIVSAVASEPHRRAALGALAAGHCASLAYLEGDGPDTAANRAFPGVETRVDGSNRLSGEKTLVLDADVAERFFVVARASDDSSGGSLVLVEVDAAASGVSILRRETLDLTRRLFSVRFDAVPATRVSEPKPMEDFDIDFGRGLAEATALLCAEMVGAMERVLEVAVEHASTRYQFGRPIGSFQAIKHKAADMLIDFESARTTTATAIEALASEDPEAPMWVAVAKAATGSAFVRMATESIQIQGGVGYTWEYDAHLYFRRAQSSSMLLGDTAHHQDQLARGLARQVAMEAAG